MAADVSADEDRERAIEHLNPRRGGDAAWAALTNALSMTRLDGEAARGVQRAQLAAAAAAYGAGYAAAGGTLSALVEEIDELEGTLLAALFEGRESEPNVTSANLVDGVRTLHVGGTCARRAAGAAYGQAVSAASQQRSRVARHDIANAIGTARNAFLLMEDESAAGSRDRFRAIATRNSQSSESLVRSYLSDDAALSPALGWEVVTDGDDIPGVRVAVGAGGVVAHRPSLAVMLDAARTVVGTSLEASLAAVSTTSAVLSIPLSATADAPNDGATVALLERLAVSLGLQPMSGSDERTLRLGVRLSVRNERNDVRGASERHDADTVPL